MNTLPVIALGCLAAGALLATSAEARPMIIEERSRFGNPEPTAYPTFAAALAVDGEFAIVGGHRDIPETPDYPFAQREFAAFLFRRTTGGWDYQRTLFTENHNEFELADYGISMQDGIGAVATELMHIFERRGDGWAAVINLPAEPGRDVEVDGGRILHGGTSGTWAGHLYERDSAGTWQQTQMLQGEFRSGDDEFEGGPVDLGGDYAAIASPNSDEPQVRTPSITVYLENGGSWGAIDTIVPPDGVDPYGPESFGTEVAIRGGDIIVSGTARTGSWLFRADPSDGSFTDAGRLQPVNSHMGGGVASRIRKSPDFVLQRSLDPDRDVRVINVFAPADSGYAHVAVLRAAHGDSVGDFDISGRRILAECGGQVCEFELPASLRTPPPRQHTFLLAADDFETSPGSQFFITTNATSRVFLQRNQEPGRTHAAVFTATNWTNQSIQADVRPLIFNGADRWVGLATRWQDDRNHYYVTLRSSGSVQLKRMVDGAYSTIASTSLPVTPYHTYRLRLESTGSNHRVFVDGELLLDVDDDSHASGRTALLAYATRVSYDNVFASPSPLATIYADDFDNCCVTDQPWREEGTGLWTHTPRATNGVFAQTAVEGFARALIGVQTGDQVVEARMRPMTFATGGGTQDRWLGLIARYADAGNYYYVTLRSSGNISLRKLSNGAIHELRSAALPVALEQWRLVRLEALGPRLRVYVNGTLTLEATDTEHAAGISGLMTWRTAADFDDVRIVQP